MTNTVEKPRSRRWLILTAAIALVLVGGAAAVALLSQKSAEGYMAAAQAHAQKGELSAALIQLRSAARKEPDNAAVRYQLAVVSLRLGDPISAEKEAKVAMERGYPENTVLPVLASAYLDQGKNNVLVDSIPEGNRPTEVEAELRTLRGLAFLGLRNVDAAEKSFQSALALDPQKLRAEIGLARVDTARQNLPAAEARLDKVLAQKPVAEVAGEAQILKAQLRRVSKDLPGALESYDKTIALVPGNLRARIERAQVLIEQNQFDRAATDARYVLDRVANHPIAVNLQARVYLEKQNEQAAYELLQRQGVGLGRYAPNLLLMGRLQFNRNQPEAAQTSLTQYLQAVPADTDVRLFLASMLLRRDTPDQAIAVLRAAPAESAKDVRVLRMLASASMRAGRPASAGAWLDFAVQESDDARTRTQIAADRISLGQTDAAIKELNTAIEMDPKSTDSKALLFATYLKQGQIDEAESIAKALVAEQPNNPLGENLLGTVSMMRNDRDGARKHFEAAVATKSDFIPAQANLARLDILERKFDDALRRYGALHEQHPKDTTIMLSLAELELSLGHSDQAEGWLTKAIATDPKAVPPRLALVNVGLLQRDAAKALAAAREMNKALPNSPEALDALARAQAFSGDLAGAAASYRTLVSIAPSPATHERVATALFAAGDTEGAKAALKTGIAAFPSAPNLGAALAILLQRSGADAEALQAAEDWRTRNPKLAAGDLIVSEVLAMQGKRQEAAGAAEQAYNKERTSQTAVAVARMRMSIGDSAKAQQGLQEFLKESPDDIPARELLVSMQISARQFDDAIAGSQQLLKVQPRNPAILNNLAWLYDQKNDPAALEYAERAMSIAPKSPAIMDTLGYILVKMGEVPRGLTLLRQAYEESKQAPEIGYHLAVALQKVGQPAEARSVLQAVLEAPGTFGEKAEAQKLFESIPAP